MIARCGMDFGDGPGGRLGRHVWWRTRYFYLSLAWWDRPPKQSSYFRYYLRRPSFYIGVGLGRLSFLIYPCVVFKTWGKNKWMSGRVNTRYFSLREWRQVKKAREWTFRIGGKSHRVTW